MNILKNDMHTLVSIAVICSVIDDSNQPWAMVHVEFCVAHSTNCTSNVLHNVRKMLSLINDSQEDSQLAVCMFIARRNCHNKI